MHRRGGGAGAARTQQGWRLTAQVQSSSISCESLDPLFFWGSPTLSSKESRTMMSSTLNWSGTWMVGWHVTFCLWKAAGLGGGVGHGQEKTSFRSALNFSADFEILLALANSLRVCGRGHTSTQRRVRYGEGFAVDV